MRKIHAVVLNDFDTTEDARRFKDTVTARLRAEHPSVIVQVDFAESLRERIVLHAYGFLGDDKRRIEEVALRSVKETLNAQVSKPLLKSEDLVLEAPSAGPETGLEIYKKCCTDET